MAVKKTEIPEVSLPAEVVADLWRMNPWWEGKPQQPLPGTRRHLVRLIRRRIDYKLAPIVVVRGPRQIGKTTALRQVIQDRPSRTPSDTSQALWKAASSIRHQSDSMNAGETTTSADCHIRPASGAVIRSVRRQQDGTGETDLHAFLIALAGSRRRP